MVFSWIVVTDSTQRTVRAGTKAAPHGQAVPALFSAAVSHLGQMVRARSLRSALRLSTRRAMKMMGEPRTAKMGKRVQNVPPWLIGAAPPVRKLTNQPVETRMTAPTQLNTPINKPCERASFSALARHCASSSGVRWTHIGRRQKDGGKKMEIQQRNVWRDVSGLSLQCSRLLWSPRVRRSSSDKNASKIELTKPLSCCVALRIDLNQSW